MTAPVADQLGYQYETQPPDSPVTEALLAALVVYFASAAAIKAAVLPMNLVNQLVEAGFNIRAARAAGRMALSVSMSGRSRYGAPAVDRSVFAPVPTMSRRVAADEPTMRARYVVNAAKRLTDALVDGRFLPGLSQERSYLQQHVQAGKKRQSAAQALDALAAKHGLLMWSARMDERTTPDCAALNGRFFTISNPPGLPGAMHPNCLLPGTVVVSPGLRATTMRWYNGEVLELLTHSGDNLAVTPNHPILTPQGWVAAGLLDEGSHVVRTSFPETLMRLVNPHHYQRPALIEDVVAAFGERRGVLPVAVPVAAEDFHGDGLGSEIAVIRADSELWDGLDSALFKPGRVEQLSGYRGDLTVSTGRLSALPFPGVFDASHGGVSGSDVPRVLLRSPMAHHELVRLGVVSTRNATVAEYFADHSPGDPVGPGEFVLAHTSHVGIADVAGRQIGHEYSSDLTSRSRQIVGLRQRPVGASILQEADQSFGGYSDLLACRNRPEIAGLVEVDGIEKITRYRWWSGHVFNLETETGWYSSSNILTHNCRCTAIPAQF